MGALISKISSFLGGQSGNLLESVADAADRFIRTKEEKDEFRKAMTELEQQAEQQKMTFMLEMERTIQKRESEVEQTIRQELESKTQFMSEEMKQDDLYTKRARPTIIYAGLGIIFLELFGLRYMILGAISAPESVFAQSSEMMQYFMGVWAGVAGVYAVGRSAEKRGTRNKLTGAMQAVVNPAHTAKIVKDQITNLKDKMSWNK